MPVTRDEIRERIDAKAMPIGALGRLEDLAVDIAMLRDTPRPALGLATLIVFAGDHGLVAEGVTAYPSAVSRAIGGLVLAGRSGASLAAKAGGTGVALVDAGLIEPLPAHSDLIERRLGRGTRNSRREPAMTPAVVEAALAAGAEIADRLARDGVDILALGEIGIGNSSAAALVGHALTGVGLDVLVGPGAGAPPGGIEHKRRVLSACAARAPVTAPRAVLAEFAGFEMAMMAGTMIAAANNRQVVIVDGFIATASALAAVALDPECRRAMVFAHASAEPGHRALLDRLAARPLMDLGLRLGEGTGAALAVPLVRSAVAILTDMADLADALRGDPPRSRGG